MPDHIHLFCKSKPGLSISSLVKHLKGYTSFKLRQTFPFLKKFKSLWAPTYYCETI